MTLGQDVVDSNTIQSRQTSTLANLIHITCGLSSTATSLEQKLCSVQQGLCIAVDALIVVVVQVLRRRTILVVDTLWTILAVPDVSVLITLRIGIATNIPAGHVATGVALSIHIVSLNTHRQETPTVVTAVPAFTASPAVGRAECREHRTTSVQRCTPVTLTVVVLVIDLEDALSTPLTALIKQILEVRIQLIVAVGDDLLHVAKSCRIACSVVLVHHHLGIEHVGHSLTDASALAGLPTHWQHIAGDDSLELGQQLCVDFVGCNLWGCVRIAQVLQIEGHVAIVVPQDIIIVHAKQTGLHLVRRAVLLATTTP